jgi:hypothetical protein
MPLDTAIASLATVLGGTSATAFFAWLQARRRQPMVSLRHEVAAAKDVNDMALATLSRLSGELSDVTRRLDAVETAQEASIRELTRVTGLFREALAALRGVIEAVQAGRIPELRLSRELQNEVEHSGSTP